MFNNRQLVFFLIVVISAALLTGCAGSRPAAADHSGAPVREGKVVMDALGRKVPIPEKVERIACLYAMSGQIVVMLGNGNQIVAVVDGLKRDIFLTQLAPNIKTAAVPSAGGVVNLEELLAVKPDVIFISADVVQNPSEAEKLDKSRIPYFVVDCKTIAEQQQVIEMVGAVIGKSDTARKYNAFYQSTINRVQTQISGIMPNDRARIYHSILEPTRTDMPHTLSADWLKHTGVINVSIEAAAAAGGNSKFFVNIEQILLWQPDAILVNEKGVVEQILNDPQWAALQAVKQRKVYQMPVGISRWGHPGSIETPLAILWTAKTIYPEQFSKVDLATETKQYYQEFFGLDLTDEAVMVILDGKGKLKKRTP